MIISIKRAMEYIKLFVLFILCTFIFYAFISFLTDVIQPSNPYRQPEGRAVKVISSTDENTKASHLSWYKDRLFQFYRYGE